MDSKKGKVDKNGRAYPVDSDPNNLIASGTPPLSGNISPEYAEKIPESFTKEQPLPILHYPDVLEAGVVADADPVKRKLFVRRLGLETTTEKLRLVFSAYGELDESNTIVVTDKNSGKSKGYGFVTFKHIDGAIFALKEPNKKIDGQITVTELVAAGDSGGEIEEGQLVFDKNMEIRRGCKSCKKRILVPDDVTGNMVCISCGVVQDFDNFQSHIGGITGQVGTYVRIGTAGTGSFRNFKEHKIFEAQKLIVDYAFKLGLLDSKSIDIKLLVEKITNGEYGQGKWFSIFVGACAYVVMRKDNKMLSIVEVTDLLGCDMYELGRMIGRVVDFIDLKLPEFDIVNSFERTIKSCPSFSEVSKDMIQRMLQQGVFLVQCLIKWFITTGRRPMPVVAAVLVFVGELNQVPVKIEDVANELHVAISTCKQRYKELLEALVKVAQVLPWGKDVTLKNILKNAPFVIQYMEMKSMTKSKGKWKSLELVRCDMEEMVGDCLHKEIGYGFDSSFAENCNSQYFDLDHSLNSKNNFPDKFKISFECLTLIYSNFLDEVSLANVRALSDMESRRKRQRSLDFQACTDWWIGKSELSKKLLLMQVLDKDVGLDVLPPSFKKGCLVKERRREKIKSAKLRIERIMHPPTSDLGYNNDIRAYQHKKSENKRNKMQADVDWEDLLIETLLLHNVKDEEIENGHYNVLLSLHVFDNGIA